MIFNVWVLIWPNQQKILGMVPATDPEKAKARRIAFLASRTNTMLSIPMLFFMVATSHFYAFGAFDTSDGGKRAIWYVVILAIAVLVEGYRTVFFLGTVPAAGPLVLAAASSAGIGAIAYWIYQAQRHDLVDAL